MEAQISAVETRQASETALERLRREGFDFAKALSRVALLALFLTPILLLSFLTADLPMRSFDAIARGGAELNPSNWLSQGAVFIAIAPLLSILFARKYGADEASRAITAAWAVAAIAVFAEVSYLAPSLEAGDMPPVRFTVVFVAAAMAAQYLGVNLYDIMRGGDRWWRAPFFGALGAGAIYGLIYFPGLFFDTGAPWINWMVTDFAIKSLIALGFLPVYAVLRKKLKPLGGLGGH